MVGCMYMHVHLKGKKNHSVKIVFQWKNNGLKRYLEMCYSVSCKIFYWDWGQVFYMREKNYSIFSDMQVLWRYTHKYFITLYTLHWGI